VLISIARTIGAMVGVSLTAIIISVQPARAGLSADAVCQKALAVGVRRVTRAALKGTETCHRKRMRGDVAATVDCNDPGQLTGGALTRFQKAVAKLEAAADRRCDAASAPATLGYDPCPAPCGLITVGTYADVGTCLACLAANHSRAVATTVFGAPLPPGAQTSETTCHAALVHATRQYTATRMRTQEQCKTAEERGYAVGTDCRNGDYQNQISDAWTELLAEISTGTSCPTASLTALDLCPSASDGTHFRDPTAAIDLLHGCVASAVNGGTNDLFNRVYAPGGPSTIASPAASAIPSRWADSGGQSLDERNPRFRLIVTQTATVTVDLSSSAADAYLYLLTADGSVVLAEDDNSGGGTNSRINTTLAVGRYLLVAATAGVGAHGNFTISTDTGSLKSCFLAYSDASYAGSSTLFCDGGTGETFTNETYSSLRVPKGLFVRAYEHDDRSGQARTYFANAPSLQPFLDNRISSIEWGAFDTEDFFVIAVSDSQITWGYCSDNSSSSLCAQEQAFFGAATEQEIALYYNTNLTNALNTIKNSIGPRAFGGVMVNGDLTEFGAQDNDLADYIALYDRGVSTNVYPGLGNHDYANNVDDCFANFCVSAMVNYLATQVSSLNVTAFDYSVTSTPPTDPPPVRYDYVGSLAYSFDIGDVHFVQLNNYPTYTRVWLRTLPNREDWYDIQSSITWLRDDLQTAVTDGKVLIANFHDWGSADVTAFRDVLDDFPVSAVYAGHYHSIYGRYTESGPYTDGASVPVLLSGSAHYGTMLVSRFTGGKLYVWVLRVDQFNGATLQVQRSGSFEDVTDLSTLFDVCVGCATTYEYVYDFR
jgi:cytolysin (calcineurin-like family phosphatase)